LTPIYACRFELDSSCSPHINFAVIAQYFSITEFLDLAKIAQIIVAAGKGARVGGAIPKQYRLLGGKTVLERTYQAMTASQHIEQTVIVIARDDKQAASIINKQSVGFATGGATRTESVKAGLLALNAFNPDYVLIHDAARPFVSPNLIKRLIIALDSADAAVPILPLADAIKTYDDRIGVDVSRDTIRAVQTPQAFRYEAIMKAFNCLSNEDSFSDDIAVAHNAGLTIADVEGERENIKLTYPEDFERSEREITMNTSRYFATGTGYDVHRFAKGDILWLCGVPIECGYTLLGHSDADAGLHALTDAVLGALAFGDIGDHFPPSDPRWKGASSDKFLEFAVQEVINRGGQIEHVDVTIICEKPKVKPHREAMRARISAILDIPLSRVSVKATTTEKLGFTGRSEGLAAQAAATLSLPVS